MAVTFTSQVGQLKRALQNEARDLAESTAHAAQAHIQTAVAEPKSGKARKDGHVASAPGEAPALDEGALANAFDEPPVIQQDADGVSATIGTNLPYAVVLELGGVHVAARPFLAPAMEAVQEDFQKGLKELMQ